jgi:hypothetical protein
MSVNSNAAKKKDEECFKFDFDYQCNVIPNKILGIEYVKKIAFNYSHDKHLAMRAIDLFI